MNIGDQPISLTNLLDVEEFERRFPCEQVLPA